MAAIPIHVAIVVTAHVTPVGTVVRKSDPSTTLDIMKTASQELRIKEDATLANTTGHPTIKTYLELEAAAGFELSHMDQTYIVTYERP